MKKILSIINIFKIVLKSKIIFTTPQSKKIVFFDSFTSKEYLDLISKKQDYFLIDCPGEKRKIEYIYLSPKIFLFIIYEIIKGNFSNFYYISLIKVINPKAIITFVDNNFAFFKLSKKLESRYRFIAIQNAHRDFFDYSELDLKKIYIPEYFCFSQFTKDHFNSLKIKVKKFNIIGSPTLSVAEKFLSENKEKNTNVLDSNPYICVVAGSMPFKSSSIDDDTLKQIRENQVKLWKYISKFSQKHEIYFKLASRQSNGDKGKYPKQRERYEDEIKTFDAINGNNKFFKKVERNKKQFSNYYLALNSKLVIGYHSTLLLECMAKRKKILCVSSRNSYQNIMSLNPLMPNDNISSMYNPSYDEFESRLLMLFKMSDKQYSEIFSFKRDYMIYYNDKISALNYLQSEIKKIIK